MKLLTLLGKIALGCVVVVIGLTIAGKIRQQAAKAPTAATAAKDPGLSPAGFFLVSQTEAKNTRVTIMSPPNCPSHEAARARALAASLNAAGIPCEMKQEIGFTFDNPADFERVQKHTGTIANPLVLVRGWAKGNPSLQDVIAQYRSK